MLNATDISQAVAREELAKFFVVADLADKAPEMFSKFIDAEWHRMTETPEYDVFCTTVVGHTVGHTKDKGEGTPSWLDLYHDKYGTLPVAWFADEHGQANTDAYARYLETRTTITAWDCTPTTGDPDFAKVISTGDLVAV